MNKNAKIAVVDDHIMFRDGIRFIIERQPGYEILFESDNGKAFLEQLDRHIPDLVLMDIEMPEMTGIEATKLALKKFPGLKIIILSMFGEQQYYHEMIEAGVKGFLLKDAGKNELERAIADVLNGGNYFSQKLLRRIITQKSSSITGGLYEPLSQRENEVLHLVCQGLSNYEIAEKLFISVKTVEGHKSKLLMKTQTTNTVKLVMFAIKNNLVSIH